MISEKRPPEPFPWLCPRCGQETVHPAAVPYRTARKYEGRPHDVELSALRVLECGQCGERLFDIDADEAIERAFRATLGLLQADEIRQGRQELGLSQKQFAGKLRFSEESVCRWETGALVQSRHADALIRLCFASPLFRQLLDRVSESPDFGRAVRYEEPAANGKGAETKAALPPSSSQEPVARPLEHLTAVLGDFPVEVRDALVDKFTEILQLCDRPAAAEQKGELPAQSIYGQPLRRLKV